MPAETLQVSIRLLEYGELDAAVELVSELFPEEGEKPAESLRAIFEPHLHPMDFAHGICDRICWVASEVAHQKIVGVVGLYRMLSDPNALYLGWFGVTAFGRSRGVGSRLLAHAIAEAKRSGLAYLRLDTTDEPYLAAANRLYEMHGMVVFRRDESSSHGIWPTVWRELYLGVLKV
jgi:ribosomal protein S18 acetylase RimI-like enzyme